jgi:hypothetical protein
MDDSHITYRGLEVSNTLTLIPLKMGEFASRQEWAMPEILSDVEDLEFCVSQAFARGVVAGPDILSLVDHPENPRTCVTRVSSIKGEEVAGDLVYILEKVGIPIRR